MRPWRRAPKKSAKCHLFRIAPELRLLIYEQLFATHWRSMELTDHFHHMRGARRYDRDGVLPRPRLLLTCKEISIEASPVFYASVRLDLHPTAGSTLKLLQDSAEEMLRSNLQHLSCELDYDREQHRTSYLGWDNGSRYPNGESMMTRFQCMVQNINNMPKLKSITGSSSGSLTKSKRSSMRWSPY